MSQSKAKIRSSGIARNERDTLAALVAAMKTVSFLALVSALPLLAGSVRIYQTNSAGDDLDVIDPNTNKIVIKIKDLEAAHGVTFSPNGARAYITCEADSSVWVVETKYAHLISKIPLSGHPNNIAVSNDGRLVFVA